MKKIALVSIMACSFLITTSFAQNMKAKDKGDNKMSVSTGKYKATYSSNFQLGNAANVQKIMDVWQDWDDNMLNRHDYFADTLAMYFPDGTMIQGKNENYEAGKKYRSSLTAVKTDLHAVVPLKGYGKDEDVVAVWGMETNSYPDGKIEKKALHEVWFFNKDGKISSMRQFQSVVK